MDNYPEFEYMSEPSGIIFIPFGLTESEEKSFVEIRMKIMQLEHDRKREEFIEKWKQSNPN